MKLSRSFCSAFRRAVTFFPVGSVSVESGLCSLRPDSFCAVSYDPAIVAVTFARSAPERPAREFAVSAAGIRLGCTLLESRDVGDHVMVLATVRNVEIRAASPKVHWRRASFELRLDYPFLASDHALDEFVNSWRSGVLPKDAWTHAAHVAVTGYFAFDNPAEVVFAIMKRGILHFNSCAGVVNGPDSGYHETLTQFWSNRITCSVRDAAPESRLDAARHAVRIFGEDRDLPSLFYSFDVVRDRRARGEWVPPDLEPMPDWCGV